MSTIVSAVPSATLLNRSFVASCLSNLLFFVSVYMLIPVLPLYLVDELHTGKSFAGIILSSFTIAALAIRPVTGFLIDNFQRKPLYMVCYFCFAAYFIGYLLAGTLLILAMVRCTHGFIYGIASTSASTLAIDSLPISKLGRGIGIFGTTSSIAMALGPMAGLTIMSHFSYQMVFAAAFAAAVAAFFIGAAIRCETRIIPKNRERFSLKKIFLAQGLPMAICLTLPAFLYGEVMNYLSLFAREREIMASPGTFFIFMAVGMILSRLIAGKLIDGGYLLHLVIIGKVIVIAAILLFVFVPGNNVFLGSALLQGLGYGVIFPSYQTIFIRLAQKEQRGTANSTYLTACDFGIGVAVLLGGVIVELTTFPVAFLIGAFMVLVSILVFIRVCAPHFKRHCVA